MCKGKNKKSVLIAFILILLIQNICYAEEITILQCKSISKFNKDYSYMENSWRDGKDPILRDKVFTKLNTINPIIKSITPRDKYSEEQVIEFKGTVIHRTGSIIMIKWANDFNNKVWIATINLNYRKAVVAESYDGITSFGINVETLTCK